jgi:hypothetical protein
MKGGRGYAMLLVFTTVLLYNLVMSYSHYYSYWYVSTTYPTPHISSYSYWYVSTTYPTPSHYISTTYPTTTHISTTTTYSYPATHYNYSYVSAATSCISTTHC